MLTATLIGCFDIFNSVFEVMKKITSTSVIKAIGVEGRDNGSGQWSGILRAEMNAVDAT